MKKDDLAESSLLSSLSMTFFLNMHNRYLEKFVKIKKFPWTSLGAHLKRLHI